MLGQEFNLLLKNRYMYKYIHVSNVDGAQFKCDQSRSQYRLVHVSETN